MGPKKGKTVTGSWNTAVLLLVFAVALVCAAFVIVHNNSAAHEQSIGNGEEYAVLLRRAKALADKYKELTGGTDLPPDLNLRGNVKAPSTVVPIATKFDSISSSAVSSTPGDLKDLVIGMAQDTDPKNLAVFCKSLRSVSKADVVIFVNTPVPQMHLNIAKESSVTLVPFDLNTVQPSFMQQYHPSTLRWALFHTYMQEQAIDRTYRRVWMIDVRDSYFQSDPFAFIPLSGEGSLHVFNGVESFPIKECGWNSGWVKDCFGPQVLRDIGSSNIICSGVSAGTTGAVTEYVRTMSDIFKGTAQGELKGQFPQCERNGVDQGAHNVLVHTGALDHLHLRRWGQAEGPVANMQAKVAVLRCGLQEGCKVSNSAGTVAVVHQYDRYPELQTWLFKKYVDWVKTGDLEAEWAYEPACAAAYAYRAETDMFKGVCDLPHKGGVTSAAACCAICDQRRDQGCEAFTFFAGTCYFKSCGKGGTDGTPRSLPGAVTGYLKS